MKVYVLREMGYYDNESTVVGVTANKLLAEYWSNSRNHGQWHDEFEVDDPSLMRDCRLREFDEHKEKRKARKAGKR
jgi:hypothetical protein